MWGEGGLSSQQAGLAAGQGFVCLTVMNKWHPQPLLIYFRILTNSLWHLMERVISSQRQMAGEEGTGSL